MAGRDASANLGGMLSQIGGAIGGMSGAGEGLMRPIMTSFRPQLDPTSVESLQRQAAFQGRIGDTEQARLFTGQALALEERNRAEEERKRKLEEGQERVKALNAFRNAVASGDPTAIATARANVEAVGQAQGQLLLPQAAAIETNERQKKTAAATEAAAAEALRLNNLESGLRAAFNAVDSIEQADVILKNAPAEVSQQAANAHKEVVGRITAQQKRAEEERDLSEVLPPSFETAMVEDKLVIPSIANLDEEVRNQLNSMAERLVADIGAANAEARDGKAIIPRAKQEALRRRRDDLEKLVSKAVLDQANNESKAKREQQVAFIDEARKIATIQDFDNKEIEAVKKDLEKQGYTLSYEDAKNYLRQQALNRHFATAPRADDDGVIDLDSLKPGETPKQGVAVPPEFQIFDLNALEKDERGNFQKALDLAESGVELFTDLFAPKAAVNRLTED
jgi:hypothetical protein